MKQMIKLRPLKLTDTDRMLEWMHDKDLVGKLKQDFERKTREDCELFITRSLENECELHKAITDDSDKYLGTVSLKNINEESAEFAIALHRDAIGKGIAINAMKEILRIGFNEYSISEIYWYVSVENKRAIRFFDINGFVRVNESEYQNTEDENRYIWYKVFKLNQNDVNLSELDYTMHKKTTIDRTYDVSVLVLNYRTDFQKLLFTLDSVISQKGISIEVVITDDGSEDNLFNAIIKYLDDKSFADYSLIYHENNHGTVRNCYDALKQCKGRFIKFISAGDALCEQYTLSKWICDFTKSGKAWSFGDAIHYKINEEKLPVIMAMKAQPQVVKCYIEDDLDECIWRYLILNDMVLGATVICDRNTILQYIKDYIDRVIFAEDMIYRKMIFKGLGAYYYPYSVVFYENGTGISTSNEEIWNKRISDDKETVDRSIMEECNLTSIQRHVVRVLDCKYNGGKFRNIVMRFSNRGRIIAAVRFKLFPRLSPTVIECKEEWWDKLCRQ